MRSKNLIIWLMVASAVTMLIFGIWPGIDLAVSGYFYGADGFWIKQSGPVEALRNFFWDAELVMTFAALILTPLTWVLKRPILLASRAWGFVLALFLIGPGIVVNALLKSYWGRARPTAVTEFGGDALFTPAYQISDQCAQNCSFVSGEGAGVMALFITLMLILFVQRDRLGPTLTAVGQGLSFAMLGFVGLHRVAAGGHFLSDVLMSWLLVALIAAILAPLLLKPAQS